MIIPLYKGKVEKNECGENYRSISWSSISGKIYAEILVETVLRKTEGITGDEQESLYRRECR